VEAWPGVLKSPNFLGPAYFNMAAAHYMHNRHIVSIIKIDQVKAFRLAHQEREFDAGQVQMP
jgi:hypothetical protein